MADYPTYQADWTVGNRMFHVRCETIEAFKEALKEMEAIIPSNEAFPNDTGHHATSQAQAVSAPVCGVHGTVMVLKPAGTSKNGRAYPAFWSCPNKNADGSFCQYRPPKEEK